jgi:hypothetical protein
VGSLFSPLDEELGLVPGSLTPRLAEAVVYMGSITAFGRAGEVLKRLLGVELSESLVRQLTERAGRVMDGCERARTMELRRKPVIPSACDGAVQQVSVDGAMVRVRGGEWAEVRTVAIGELGKDSKANDLSYFSRLCDADEFIEQALVEVDRRKTEQARAVAAVADGAEWQQRFYDVHTPTGTRILDWGHCAEHLGTAAQALFGPGTLGCSTWLETQLATLRRAPGEVLRALAEVSLDGLSGERREDVRRVRHYLEKRADLIDYPAFVAQGLPIGSGIVESPNKLVVEERLKGAGMHWARPHANELLALRSVLCSKRWDSQWPDMRCGLRRPRRRSSIASPPKPIPTQQPMPESPAPEPHCTRPRTPTFINGKPTNAHPWKAGLARQIAKT